MDLAISKDRQSNFVFTLTLMLTLRPGEIHEVNKENHIISELRQKRKYVDSGGWGVGEGLGGV